MSCRSRAVLFCTTWFVVEVSALKQLIVPPPLYVCVFVTCWFKDAFISFAQMVSGTYVVEKGSTFFLFKSMKKMMVPRACSSGVVSTRFWGGGSILDRRCRENRLESRAFH